LPSKTHRRQKRCSKNKREIKRKMNNETLTSGIKHWGLSVYSSILPRLNFGAVGQEIARNPLLHIASVVI